jgi:hypothetical protein
MTILIFAVGFALSIGLSLTFCLTGIEVQLRRMNDRNDRLDKERMYGKDKR